MQDVRRSWAWQQLVVWAKHNLPWVCHLCGDRIPVYVSRFHPLSYALDHKLTVRDHPELSLSKDNVAPSHKRCNDARKARPLTPGLVLELTERFAARPPAALGFFGDESIASKNLQGRAGRNSGAEMAPMTVIPLAVPPRLHTVTSPAGHTSRNVSVTQASDSELS